MNDLPDVLVRLVARVETLEQRISALEHSSGATDEVVAQATSPAMPTPIDEPLPPSMEGKVFPLLGKAMLGVAGAYLLRAIEESNSLPKGVVAAVAIAYAFGWLVRASLTKANDWITGTIYACTSALILAPMLWELALRFEVLPAWVAASVVGGFVLAASALAWRRNFAPVLWVANGTAVAIALALSVASHQLMPFIAALLVMLIVGEYAAGCDHESGVRVLVALAVDLLVWAEIYIYSGPQNARGSYPPLGVFPLIAPGVALFLITSLSLIYRTVLREKKISVFETVETMIAFMLAACALIYLGPPSFAMVLGILCLMLSFAGYAGAIVRFGRSLGRCNYLVFANWSGALLLAGSLLCLPPGGQAPWLSAVAVAATFAGARLERLVLEIHGMMFILAAAWISGIGDEVFKSLMGTLPHASGVGICMVSLGAVLCYAAVKPREEMIWPRQVLSFVFAGLATALIAALGVQGLAGLVALWMPPGTHHVAFIRTMMACIAAISLAYSGARWRRQELNRIAYSCVALLALKLVVEDLRHGHMAFIAGSIFLFALTLIVVPRVARLEQKA